MIGLGLGLGHIVLLASAVFAPDGGGAGAPSARSLAPPAQPLIAPIVAGRRVDPAGVYRAEADEPELRPAKDGSGDLLYEHTAFSARIAPDGSVTFRDKRHGPLNFFPWRPRGSPRNVPTLQSTLRGLMQEHKVPRVDDTAPNDSQYLIIPLLTPYRPDPREGCRGCTNQMSLLPMNLMSRFDLTEELIRFSGKDPHRYEKAKFLLITREFRSQKAAKNHAEEIRRAHWEISQRLPDIACDESRSVSERRQIIEKLRAELDGTSPEAIAAVQKVNRFVESRFGSPDGGDNPCP